MKKYIGTKQVSATPAWRIDGKVYPKDGEVPRSMNREDGYKVVYEDGYESWSPKDVFEKAYKVAETFLDRLMIERKELAEKLEKLCLFIDSPKFMDVVKDENQRELLIKQRDYMGEYLNILNQRIKTLE
jgi:hypothetical protein